MPLFNSRYQTESNRLKNWDYSSEAIYFITLVTQNRECVFGAIDDDKMILSDNGKIIETELLKSITIREQWFFHNWVIMPNHIHLLVEIKNDNSIRSVETHDVETHCSASLQLESESHSESKPPKLSRKPNSISSFVAIFKSVTTKQINTLINNNDAPRRDAQHRDARRRDARRRDALQCVSTVWQSNYHDHIVRNYNSFDTIYKYIKNNPKNWNTDSINSKLE